MLHVEKLKNFGYSHPPQASNIIACDMYYRHGIKMCPCREDSTDNLIKLGTNKKICSACMRKNNIFSRQAAGNSEMPLVNPMYSVALAQV